MADLLSVKDLYKGGGNSVGSKLEALAIDSSANFLNGQATSAFSKLVNPNKGKLKNEIGDAASIMQDTAQLATNVAGIAGVAMNADKLAQEVTQALIGLAIGKLQEVIQEEIKTLTQKISQLPMSVPQKIQKYTQEAFNRDKKSLSDFMSSVNSSAEDQQEKEEEKQKKESEEKKKNDVKKKLENTKKTIQKTLKDANEQLESINKYIESGPEWLLKKTNGFLDEKAKFVRDETNSAIASAEKAIDEFCKARGEALGKKMAKQYNAMLEKQAKKKIAKLDKQTKKAKTKANTAIQKGILKAMSMTGINIPFTPSL